MGRLDGKVAIITGAARGHAEEIARLFATEGAAVSICDIVPLDELDGTVGAAIRAEGGLVRCFQTDVSQEDQVNAMVEATMETFGTVDILCNVVGIAGPTNDVWNITLAEWRRTLAVNLDSMFLCSKAALPKMIRKRWGRVINFSSGTGKKPLSHRTPYATTKMAVIGFTRTLAADVGRYNITVNAICPGQHYGRSMKLTKARAEYMGQPFDEAVFRKQWEERRKSDKAVLAGHWLASEGYTEKETGPKEAALLALFLASDDASMITGQDLNIGGRTMW